ncbi:hypothetical protein V6N12_063142 [Hibiscus sabdariffa]|uniref:Uncharacterized protein n=1 Tax=Hibiscus sabdariffa TaxID=183260 RepID=A0ABR2FAX6_9ROSI
MDTTPTTTTFPTNGAKYIFTLDDIPVSRRAQRLQEFHSWMETQKLAKESNYEILTEFVSRFKGVPRNWWSTVPPGDQMQSAVSWAMHMHLLGNPDDVKTLQRKEFFKRKCCSFERRDLEKHFHTMIKLFFTLGADQSLKQVILASIPELLQNAIDRNLQQRRRNILQLTIGEIQQETFIALEELCDKKQIIKDYMSGSKELDKACKVPRLTIKCKKEPQCHCSGKMGFDEEGRDDREVSESKTVKNEGKLEEHHPKIYTNASQTSLSLTEVHDDDDDGEGRKLELGPRRTLKEQLEKDKEDESLMRWKEQLLGTLDFNSIEENLEPDVKILSLAIRSPGRPDILLPIPDKGNPKGLWFTLKEGSKYSLQFTFRVSNNLVSGLKYTNTVWKTGVKVDSAKEMMGTFSPKAEPYTHEVCEETTPSGMFARGNYSARSKMMTTSATWRLTTPSTSVKNGNESELQIDIDSVGMKHVSTFVPGCRIARESTVLVLYYGYGLDILSFAGRRILPPSKTQLLFFSRPCVLKRSALNALARKSLSET